MEISEPPFDWKPGTFGESENSCWFRDWQKDYAHCIAARFGKRGGLVAKIFSDSTFDNKKGIGRLWLLPKDGMLVVINPYLTNKHVFPLTAPYVMSAITGGGVKEGRKAGYSQYVNGQQIWIVGDPQKIENVDTLDFALE
jgi:hypothetical protein